MTLSDCEDKLEVAGLLDAEIVEAGNEPRDRNGKNLRPQQRDMSGKASLSQ